jgi:Ca2+-binding EF-hand superfamily protein
VAPKAIVENDTEIEVDDYDTIDFEIFVRMMGRITGGGKSGGRK